MFRKKYWQTPPLDILKRGEETKTETYKPEYIAELLNQIGTPSILKGYTAGAQIITYHFDFVTLKDVSKTARIAKALTMALKTPCNIVASDRAHYAVQVARRVREIVALRQVIGMGRYNDTNRPPTLAALGTDTAGQGVYIDIADMPHMLIAGATGSGKSVSINTILCSMLYSASPSSVQFVMIDPKQVELSLYAGLPHLTAPIITDTKKAIEILRRVNVLMDRRYKQMARKKVRNIDGMNVPRVVIVIDELADLMITGGKAAETPIVRIAQLGRAAGIHLIIATQKPLVKVVTGLIQGNIPSKLAFQTASAGDSVRILGHKGAEKLTGKGDAWLKLPDKVEETRLQCAYTSQRDVEAVVNYWKYDAKRRG